MKELITVSLLTVVVAVFLLKMGKLLEESAKKMKYLRTLGMCIMLILGILLGHFAYVLIKP